MKPIKWKDKDVYLHHICYNITSDEEKHPIRLLVSFSTNGEKLFSIDLVGLNFDGNIESYLIK